MYEIEKNNWIEVDITDEDLELLDKLEEYGY